MKRLSYLLFILILSPSFVWAAPIKEDKALQHALNFLSTQNIEEGLKRRAAYQKQIKLLYTQKDSREEVPLLYVFGDESTGGYVVVAGDDAAASPILGYSAIRKFNADSIPCGLNLLLEEYGRQLSYARENPTLVEHSAPLLNKPTIAPLITSKWSQRAPFNNLCPLINSTRCLTGCMATAMAQFMYYYKWPEKGKGSNSYTWRGETLTADFESTTYQWDKMRDTYSEDTSDIDDAVATLMHHCGIAVEMSYGTSSSGAYIDKLSALEDYFSYALIYNIDSRLSTNMEDKIYSELTLGCPVLVQGANSASSWDTSSHAFICDGYADGYFHFNFGWGGNWDDYYLLSAIKANGYNYSNSISYFCGFRKAGFTFDGCNYAISPNGDATLINGKVEGDVVIPENIIIDGRNYIVKTIEDKAFYNNTKITSVTIPASVKSIGNKSFEYCTGLTSIVIPDGVTTIGDAAFFNCKNLSSITIPENVNYIGENAFENTPWYDNHPQGLLYLGKVAYKYIGSMPANSAITLREGTISIGGNAFYKCSGLTTISIPESVTTIGGGAFYNCSSLSSIFIPKNVSSIGGSAFFGCPLVSVTINSSHIGKSWFYGKSSIKDLIIGRNVVSIGEGAFENCVGLTSVSIPNSVISIGKKAFSGCSSIMSLDIGSSLTEMDASSFNGCNALSTITFNCPEIDKWFSGMSNIKDVVMNNNVTTICDNAFYGCTGLKTVTIPGNVKSIGEGAFRNCSSLNNMTFSEGIESIGSLAFGGCSQLSTINIPRSVTSIGYAAFSGCTGLTAISLSANLAEISQSAFSNCKSLTSVTIPDGVVSIGVSAFEGCSKLVDITIPGSVSSIGSSVFKGCSSLASIVIPNSVNRICEETFYNCAKLSDVKIGEDITSIGSNAFYGCKLLNSIKIPSGITSIGSAAFRGCSNLASISIPNSIESIGNNAFYGCSSLASVAFDCSFIGNWFSKLTSLKEISIGNNVTGIGDNAFYSCTGLKTVTIPGNVKSIGEGAFRDCSGLNTMIFSEGIESIGSLAFIGCTGIEYIRIPNSVTELGSSAFQSCTSLISIVMSENINGIYSYSFHGCTNLASITLPKNLNYFDSTTAFGDCHNLANVRINSSVPLVIINGISVNQANATLYVPAGSKAAYQAADYWKEFKQIVEIGDLNNDGTVDTQDAILTIQQYLGEGDSEVDKMVSDMNNDGSIDTQDAILIIERYLNNE